MKYLGSVNGHMCSTPPNASTGDVYECEHDGRIWVCTLGAGPNHTASFRRPFFPGRIRRKLGIK